MSVPRSLFYFLFAVSGFSGLIYESLWAQYLKLFLGHAAYAQTLVLALFMGGMAAGSAWCTRAGGRWRNLLLAYAVAEAAIGLAAFAFHPVFVAATDWAYASLLPALGGEASARAVKWLLAALLILPQSVLLGTTFPLMSAGLIRRHPGDPGRSLAMLYFTNSFGAAVGVLASGFVLIDRFGLPGTLGVAGALNVVLAITVAVLARGEPLPPAPERRAFAGESPRLLLAVAFLTGTASFAYEIGWIRMLTLVPGASTHSCELMLSAFILGLALGSLWIRRRIDSLRDPARALGGVQIAMGLAALATVPVYGWTFDWMAALIRALARTDEGHFLFLSASHAIALAVMLPASFCAGMTLPLITRALLPSRGEASIGAVYAFNTLGSIVGVFAAAQIGLPLLGLKGLIASGAALDAALGLVLLWGAARTRTLPAFATAGVVLAFAAVLAGVPLDRYAMASGVFRRGELYHEPDVQLLEQIDGRTSTVSLVDFPEGRSLRTNGKSDGAIAMRPEQARIPDELTMVLTAAVPLAYQPHARSAAVIGLGTGLTTHTLLASPAIESVDTIEIEPAMAQASRGFAPYNANAFADPRSHIVFDDAKSFFSIRNRRYDVIISEPSNPWVSGVSSLFTREFYRRVQQYLEPGGVLAQWFQLYEIDEPRVASVLLALAEEFPDYAVYTTTSDDLLIIAGSRETLARPLADVTRIGLLAQELRRVHVQGLGDIELRRLGGKDLLAPLFASYGVAPNSDYHPYLDQRAARDRFLQRQAGGIAAIGASDIPVAAMLEARAADWSHAPSLDGADYLDKIEALRDAYAVRAAVMLGQAAPGIPLALQKDLQVIAQRPACSNPERVTLWFSALFQLTRSVAGVLPASDIAQLWHSVAALPCEASLPAGQRQWIELMRASAGRDAKRMSALAEALLDPSLHHTAAQNEYLVAAAMAGYLASGERGRAAGIWRRHRNGLGKQPGAALRLLFAHAFPSETMR